MMLASHPEAHFAGQGLKEANMQAKWLLRAEKSPPENFSSLTSDKSSAKVKSIHVKPRNTQQRNIGVEWRPPPMLTEIDMLGLPDSHSPMKGLAVNEPSAGKAHRDTSRRTAKPAAGANSTPRGRSPLQRTGPGTFSSRSIS